MFFVKTSRSIGESWGRPMKDKTSRNVLSRISDLLDSDENLIWWDQPARGLVLHQQDSLLIPFSLLWGGGAIFSEIRALSGAESLFFRLWGVPFVLIGIYLIFGRFIYDAWRRNNTAYALTDQRAIFLFRNDMKMINISGINELKIVKHGVDFSSISFGPESISPYYSHGVLSGKPAVPTFEMIKDGEHVFSAIRGILKMK